MDLENTILSQISQSKKKNQKPYDVTHVWVIKLKATNEQGNKSHRHRHQYASCQREGREGC